MNVKPILFSVPMVRAILEGRKTQTRRVITQPPNDSVIGGGVCDPESFPERPYFWLNGYDGSPVMPIINPPKILHDDLLWVRENYRLAECLDDLMPSQAKIGGYFWYEADQNSINEPTETIHYNGKLRPSIFMPRWASRIVLEVTDIHIQPLNNISPEDCFAEGISRLDAFEYINGLDDELYESPQEAYAALWDALNKDKLYSWEANPWIVGYSFKPHFINIDDYLQGVAA